ncbi:MAG: ADP-forming succinate--CoA ligase subunit beta [Nitrososphaerota archaeon]|nr:ADP-forming succinate--CoA ligase subunit beta [Nitrososphaerales archaeon]MDW8044772.1 ADP-forming succinate--CoA ligase subunit beta [Nitrososphaerota archaeon]
MKLFEYEAKNVMKSYGLPIPQGSIAKSVDEAVSVAEKIGLPVMLKAQVLVGGRGKAGGIKSASTLDEVRSISSALFSLKIKDESVESVLVEKKLNIVKELFIAVTIDRSEGLPVMIASSMGGMDVEEMAKEHPESIVKLHIDPRFGIVPFQARKVAQKIGLREKQLITFSDIAVKMYKIYEELDAELVESNPLAITDAGELIIADARLNIVDDALFRHKEFQELSLKRMPESTELERLAKSKGVRLVDLGGDIGVIGNGAGLTMATIDVLTYYGAKAACFLDVGGGASAEEFARALTPLIEYPRVKAILINILGGITRCDEVARGIKKVYEDLKFTKPLTVRLSGTNEEEGQRILREIGINTFTSIDDAVKNVIRQVSSNR